MSDRRIPSYGPRDMCGYGEHPPKPNWPNDARIAVQIVLNYEEGSELAPEFGDGETETALSEFGPGLKPLKDGTRNANMESTYEYGSRVGVWRILRLLDEHELNFSVYACAIALERNPEFIAALKKREDRAEVVSHGYRWVDRARWTAEEEEENVRKAIASIANATGRPPRGWFYGHVQSNAGERSRGIVARVYDELQLELKYYSDDYSDDLPFYVPYPGDERAEGIEPRGLMIIPHAHDTNDYRFGAQLGFITGDDWGRYLIDTFDELYREGKAGSAKMMTISLHARIVGRPGRIAGLRRFIEHAKKHEGVWFATREEIADHWRAAHPYRLKEQ